MVGATSRPDMLDAALLRPGRLDRLLYCGFPTARERLQVRQPAADDTSPSSSFLHTRSQSVALCKFFHALSAWRGPDTSQPLPPCHVMLPALKACTTGYVRMNQVICGEHDSVLLGPADTDSADIAAGAGRGRAPP